jgi:transcription elongation factor GreA
MQNNTKKVLLTKEGLEELQQELDTLKKAKRPASVARVARARDFGDLAENAEYAAAREELAFIDGRIQELEEILKNVELMRIKHTPGRDGIVELGSTVLVETNGGVDEFTIVGSLEADPNRGKISNESPVGKALLGAKVGDIVEIASTVKTVYKVKEIK